MNQVSQASEWVGLRIVIYYFFCLNFNSSVAFIYIWVLKYRIIFQKFILTWVGVLRFYTMWFELYYTLGAEIFFIKMMGESKRGSENNILFLF